MGLICLGRGHGGQVCGHEPGQLYRHREAPIGRQLRAYLAQRLGHVLAGGQQFGPVGASDSPIDARRHAGPFGVEDGGKAVAGVRDTLGDGPELEEMAPGLG